MGGQTALNLAVELHEAGILEKYGVEKLEKEMKEIAKQYNIENPEDIRIVFAFDN